MVCGLVPVVGVPLPLVSYGGTSVVTLLAGFGILMACIRTANWWAHEAASAAAVAAGSHGVRANCRCRQRRRCAGDDQHHFDLSRPEISRFLDELSAQGVDRAAAAATWRRLNRNRGLSRRCPSGEKTMAGGIRSHFLTNERIEAGVRLWREHRELLDQVALRWHVEPQYVLAIVGVETYFGRTMGHYRVLDALATLAFDYPPRAEFFRSELAQFLLLTHEEQIDR